MIKHDSQGTTRLDPSSTASSSSKLTTNVLLASVIPAVLIAILVLFILAIVLYKYQINTIVYIRILKSIFSGISRKLLFFFFILYLTGKKQEIQSYNRSTQW